MSRQTGTCAGQEQYCIWLKRQGLQHLRLVTACPDLVLYPNLAAMRKDLLDLAAAPLVCYPRFRDPRSAPLTRVTRVILHIGFHGSQSWCHQS
jgi:hypothetical protein